MVDTRRSRPPPQQKRRGAAGRALADRMSSSRDRRQGDTYRPSTQQNGSAPSRSDFTFTSNTPGPQFPASSAVDRPARRNHGRNGAAGPNNARPAMRRGNAAASNFRGGRRNGRGGFRPQAAHERALLQTRDNGTEHFLGVAHETNKFRDLADLSDDEEADMDVGTDDTDGEEVAPSNSKAIRTQSTSRADGDSVPKWSNPDPYTVLPPPEETTGKRIDFVKLIRKAKNQITEQEDGTNAVAANDDFISFGDDEDDTSEVIGAPTEPASLRSQPMQGSMNEVAAISTSMPYSAPSAGLPSIIPVDSGSKKRKHPADYIEKKSEWVAQHGRDPAPWAYRDDYERLRDQPEKLLHNEVLDFYDFVAPTEHDNEVRRDLIHRVQSVIGGQFQTYRGKIHCFGSFPVRLYLPTADMDLVFVTDEHYRGGPAVLTANKNQMYNLARKLKDRNVAIDTLVIPKARVPIIKFTDLRTGLPVDISFENMSGLVAQGTLQNWVAKYGDSFTYLVAITKQLLAMYGLNDNGTGGLGGLSICCLVVSFLQHQNDISDNLGKTLIKFLDYYGNQFDYARRRIVVDPPALKQKGPIGIDGRPERPDRLAIQDPNDPQNNISGGSYKADQALKLFSWAHDVLVERMRTVRMNSVHDLSILESILGGDYSTYQEQRARMRNIRIQEKADHADDSVVICSSGASSGASSAPVSSEDDSIGIHDD